MSSPDINEAESSLTKEIGKQVQRGVQKLPPWVLILLILGGGGLGVDQIAGWAGLSTREAVAEQIEAANYPLKTSVDNLSEVIRSLDRNLQQQAELTRYNQCQIRALDSGTDLADCNSPPDFGEVNE